MADVNSTPAAESSTSVFITGAASGTGLSLIRELVKRGHKVTGAVKTPEEAATIRRLGALPTFPQLDRINDVRGLLQMRRVTHVVHLAHLNAGGVPQYRVDESEYMPALRATDEIVAAAGRAGVQRVIFPSFAFAYGDTHGHPATEESRTLRNTPLLAALLDAENAVLDGGIPGYVLRCGYLYGAGILAMRELEKVLRAGGSVVKSAKPAAWLHEDDLAVAILTLIEQPVESGESVGTVLNLSDESHLSPDAFMKLFAEAVGVGEPSGISTLMLPWRTTPAQRDALDTSFSVSTAKARALGWAPQFKTPAAGIDKTLLLWRAEASPEPEPEQIPERAIVTL